VEVARTLLSQLDNAIRELGGVFGVAVLAAIFTTNGGYHSAQQFVDGMNPAVMISALLVACGRDRRVCDQARRAD
jgi:hypothetical protein